MRDPIPGVLEKLAARPRCVIMNKVMLSAEPDYWTLHNIGTGVMPYQIFNEIRFIEYFTSHSYVVRDRWNTPEISLQIPFHPHGFVRHGTGFCFEYAGKEV